MCRTREVPRPRQCEELPQDPQRIREPLQAGKAIAQQDRRPAQSPRDNIEAKRPVSVAKQEMFGLPKAADQGGEPVKSPEVETILTRSALDCLGAKHVAEKLPSPDRPCLRHGSLRRLEDMQSPSSRRAVANDGRSGR